MSLSYHASLSTTSPFSTLLGCRSFFDIASSGYGILLPVRLYTFVLENGDYVWESEHTEMSITSNESPLCHVRALLPESLVYS